MEVLSKRWYRSVRKLAARLAGVADTAEYRARWLLVTLILAPPGRRAGCQCSVKVGAEAVLLPTARVRPIKAVPLPAARVMRHRSLASSKRGLW